LLHQNPLHFILELANDETNAKKDLEKAIALFPISTAEAYHGRAIAKSGLDDKQGGAIKSESSAQ
jgi:hypothetical protein